MDLEERYERRAPFGVPFAESFGLHLLIVGALASSVWLHSRIHGNEWGQNMDAGAIQANLVSNAPSIPLPEIQKPTDNVLATENPSPAPAIEKQETLPAPDLKAIPIPVKQPAKRSHRPRRKLRPSRNKNIRSHNSSPRIERTLASSRLPAFQSRWLSSNRRHPQRRFPSPAAVVSAFPTMWPSFNAKRRKTG